MSQPNKYEFKESTEGGEMKKDERKEEERKKLMATLGLGLDWGKSLPITV